MMIRKGTKQNSYRMANKIEVYFFYKERERHGILIKVMELIMDMVLVYNLMTRRIKSKFIKLKKRIIFWEI